MSAKRLQAVFLLLFVSILGSAGWATQPPEGGRFSATGGVEYQVISQRYYESIIDTSTLDPIELWQPARDEINEMIVRSALGYHHRRLQTTFDLTGTLDLSPSRFLGGGELAYVRGGRDSRAAFFGRFENRSPFESETGSRNGYNHFRTTFSGAKRVSSLFRLTARTGYEQISYQTERPASDEQPSLFYLYDYSLLSGEVGTDIGRWLSTRLIYGHRRVPDSVSAGYDNYRYDMELTHLGSGHSLTLAGELELKDYFQPGGRNDFWAGHLGANFWRDIGSQVRSEE
ncbi:MAG: hypothetical protein PHR28_13690, partial [candidate division Zixibacteria bacterium]|nr:hypothetical protein [candidate division Zixibacteria bacterium]